MGRNGRRIASWSVLAAALLVTALVLAAAPVGAAGGVRYVDKYLTRNCQGKTPCYHTIQAAVNHAKPGDTIYVFPATYEAGVDLNEMDPQGDITLITVDANGDPTPGTVTVDNDDAAEIYTGDPLLPFNGDVTIDGFVLRSEYGAIDLWVGSGNSSLQGAGAGLGPALTGDVEIRNVDASHTGGDGISARAEGNVTIKDCTTNDNEGFGIGVLQTWGDVTITGCTSNQNKGPATSFGGNIGCLAGGICVMGAGGQVTIRDNTANGNAGEGILVGLMYTEGQEAGLASVTTPDQVVIDKCTANNNDWEGIIVRAAEGDVTITDCTTNGNGDGVVVGGLLFGEGAEATVSIDVGDVTIENCTAIGNDEAGFDVWGTGGTLSIQSCIARDNDAGVELSETWFGEGVLVNGSVICGNECGVYLDGPNHDLGNDASFINLEGNWWGCAGGPEAVGCDPICEGQQDSIAVDFTPWIAKISDSATVDPAMVGQPTVVSFQFSGGPPAVYLGQGPGDLRGPAPFTVSTDNGTLNGNGATVEEFIDAANGTLKVTLVPARGGTATVTVSGPCGLSDVPGNTIVLGVTAEEFVPEPGSVILLASGLMGLAGYAGLRMRRR